MMITLIFAAILLKSNYAKRHTDSCASPRLDGAEIRQTNRPSQGSNKRNNRWVTYQGERYTIAQLARHIAEECGLRPAQFQRAFEKAIYAKPE